VNANGVPTTTREPRPAAPPTVVANAQQHKVGLVIALVGVIALLLMRGKR